VNKSTRKPGRQKQWEHQLFPGQEVPVNLLWRNTLNPNSLRLALPGYRMILENKQHAFYHFSLKPLSNLQLLQLDHLLSSPYFLSNRTKIELMGEQDSIMLGLHGNDLAQYLHNLDQG
jgi:hypothetical protein